VSESVLLISGFLLRVINMTGAVKLCLLTILSVALGYTMAKEYKAKCELKVFGGTDPKGMVMIEQEDTGDKKVDLMVKYDDWKSSSTVNIWNATDCTVDTFKNTLESDITNKRKYIETLPANEKNFTDLVWTNQGIIMETSTDYFNVIGKAVTIHDGATNTDSSKTPGDRKVCCVFQNATASAPTTAPGLSLMAGMASALLASIATGANSA